MWKAWNPTGTAADPQISGSSYTALVTRLQAGGGDESCLAAFCAALDGRQLDSSGAVLSAVASGSTLLGYLTRYRIHKAAELLKDCREKVYEVAEQVGYRDIGYFSNTFKKITGKTPSEYQDSL